MITPMCSTLYCEAGDVDVKTVWAKDPFPPSGERAALWVQQDAAARKSNGETKGRA
jgi:hypothetical protein